MQTLILSAATLGARQSGPAGENFPENRFLSPGRAAALTEALAKAGIAGGSVYDALVASTAIEHSLKLATSNQRALVTYHALQVDVEVLADCRSARPCERSEPLDAATSSLR